MNKNTCFLKPELRKNFYISRAQQPIIGHIVDAKIKKITKLNNDKGYILSVHINDCDKILFDNIDENALQMLIDNNKTWFDNNLSTHDITDMFKDSVCEHTNTMSIIINDNTKIYINNHSYDAVELLTHDMTYFRKCMLNIRVQHAGLYIYSKQTFNRWYANSINIYDEDTDIEEKENIEESWGSLVEESDNVLKNRITSLENTRSKIKNLYLDICKNNSSKEWECKIKELKNLIQNIIF